MSPKSMVIRTFVLVLRSAVTIGILAYFVLRLDWNTLFDEIRELESLYIAAAFIAAGTSHILSAVRWWHLLKVQSINMPLPNVAKLTFIGQFFNLFMLGSVGGDTVKLLYMTRAAPNQKTHATLSTIMDRVLGLFVMIAFALIAILSQIDISLDDQRLRTYFLALITALSLLLLTFLLAMLVPVNVISRLFPGLWQHLPKRHLFELTIAGFHQHGRALNHTLFAFIFSTASWLFVCLAGILIARSMHLIISDITLSLILALVCIATTLPISIGGHGIREGSFAMLFTIFGHTGGPTQSQAIVFSVLFFLAFSFWGLPGGLLYLFGTNQRIDLKPSS